MVLLFAGNIRIFCRARPLFEDEGSSVVEFPDDYTIRVNTGDESLSNSKKEFAFDRVYGPHVGQGKMVLFYVTLFWLQEEGLGGRQNPGAGLLCFLLILPHILCLQLSCSVMFNQWCNQLWMDIIFPYLHMDKHILEKHTLWLFFLSFAVC